MQKKKQWVISFEISLLVGITLSLVLSFAGNMMSGMFTIYNWMIGFLVSAVISTAVGFLVPMGKISMRLHWKFEKRPFVAVLLEALISDSIYTPVICYLMVLIAWFRSGRHMPFLFNFLRSLTLTYTIGFVILLVILPLYQKLVFGLNKIDRKVAFRHDEEHKDGSKENGDLV